MHLSSMVRKPQSDSSLNTPGLPSPSKGKWDKRLVAASIMVVVLIIGIAASLILSSKKVEPKAEQHPVLTVTVQRPSIKTIDHQLAVHGSISAWDPVSVGATAGGLTTKSILVEEGMLVKKGQVLATLDSSQLQAQIQSEKARLASSLANASKSVQPNRREDINALAAAVAQAESTVADYLAALDQANANLENAKTNLKRYQFLRSAGVVSAQETETRATTLEVAEAAMRSAKERAQAAKFALKQTQERLAMAQSGGRKEDIQIANASVNEITGNVRKLQTQIDETIVRAPVDGLITRRDAHIGDVSASGRTMFLMARDNRLELKAQVPESDLRFVKPGQVVVIDSALTGTAGVKGAVREISPLVDASTRLATVRIDVPSNSGLKEGMYAEGKIAVGRYAALTVPAQAVLSRDEKSTVFVLNNNKDNKVESRQVVAGDRSGDLVEIKAGLTERDPVVLEGAGFLKNGDCVAVSN
jgi:HlyD family secretion protein